MVEGQVLKEPFESIDIDLVGPLAISKGVYRYKLTAVCLATCYLSAVQLRNVRALTMAQDIFPN